MFNFLLLDSILGMPNIMSDELLNGVPPVLPKIVVLQRLNLIYQSIDILNENIVSRDQNSLLVLDGARICCTDLICAGDRLLSV